MALLPNINIGSSPNDGTGSSLRDAFTIVNENFQLIEAFFPDSDVANLTANITSTGTSAFNTLNGATIGNAGAAIVGATVSAATIGNSGATLTGTISTAAQTNITSLGTLSALTVAGTLTHTGKNVTTTVLDTDNIIVGNLAASGNITVTVPNAANNTSRSLTFTVYDPSGAVDLRMSIDVASGTGNIFTTANTNFSSTDIGTNVGVQSIRLISNGQYWITI
jgi:hypothetical protein